MEVQVPLDWRENVIACMTALLPTAEVAHVECLKPTISEEEAKQLSDTKEAITAMSGVAIGPVVPNQDLVNEYLSRFSGSLPDVIVQILGDAEVNAQLLVVAPHYERFLGSIAEINARAGFHFNSITDEGVQELNDLVLTMYDISRTGFALKSVTQYLAHDPILCKMVFDKFTPEEFCKLNQLGEFMYKTLEQSKGLIARGQQALMHRNHQALAEGMTSPVEAPAVTPKVRTLQ